MTRNLCPMIPDRRLLLPALSAWEPLPPWAVVSVAAAVCAAAKNDDKNGTEDWLADIEVDPEKLRFDIDVFIPNPADMEIAPERVWRDEIFTYIDFGPKALTMTERPIVNLLSQGSEVPIGFRTRGPNGRLMVVEGIGDLVCVTGNAFYA